MGYHISLEQFIHLLPVFAPLMLLQLLLILTSLISILKKETSWDKKMLWIVISLVITIVGPVVYFVIGKKMLEKDAEERKEAQDVRN